MAFDVNGFRTMGHIGLIDPSKAGTMRNQHAYVTNDDAAAVETSNYFLELAARLKVGDQIFCSLDLDGTPAGRIYVVAAVNTTTVSITRFQATAAA